MSEAVGLPDDRRDTLRAQVLSERPGWYSPWLHLAVPSLMGLGVVLFAVWSLHALTALQLLTVPIVFVFSNATEWRAHRDLLHKRRWPLHVLYDRHTPQHHMIFVEGDMAIRSWTEFRLVLLPAYGIVAILSVTIPGSLLLSALGLHNVAMLFLATTTAYVMLYEWFHLAYHLPAESWLGRRWLIRVLRGHHTRHHNPTLMQRWNFNVTLPLWDLVRGTIYRGTNTRAERD